MGGESNSLFGVHRAVFLNYETKIPIISSRIVTALAINDTGDLTPREGGSWQYPLHHFENRKSIEIQATFKDWRPEFINLATGGAVTKNATSAAAIQSLDNVGTDLEFTAIASSVQVFGTYLLSYGGATDKWSLYLLDSTPTVPKLTNGTLVEAGIDLSTSDTDLNIGFNCKLATDYTPAAGQRLVFRALPGDGADDHTLVVDQNSRRPFVSATFVAEQQQQAVTIEVNKMICSSGFPVTMNEKTDNEFQLTFMASQGEGDSWAWRQHIHKF